MFRLFPSVCLSVCLSSAALLLVAARVLGGGGLSMHQQVMNAGPQHQALLPAADTPKPWATVVAATYANLKNAPVLYSRSGTGGKGRWVSPGQAVVVEEVEQDGGGGAEEERVEYAKRLTKV